MASSRTRSRRPLGVLVVLLIALIGSLAAGVRWSNASWSPNLALDLAGGTQIILEPRPDEGSEEQVTPQIIDDAIEVIRQRVNGSGVSEAEITSQGGQNIVVELPGDPEEQQRARELVSQSAQMRFRPVLVESAGAPVAPDAADPGAPPTDGATPPEGATPTDGATPTEGAPATDGATSPPATSAPAPTTSTNGRAVPELFAQGTTPAPTDPAATDPAATDPAATDPAATTPAPAEGGQTPAPTPTDASDLAQITEEMAAQFQALDCSDPENLAGGVADVAGEPLVTCDQSGAAKYILGPVEVEGSRIETASAGLQQTSQGFTTGEWAVNLEFDREGAREFRAVTERLIGLQQPQNQFAIVLDGLVVSAPRTNSVISDGRAEITGSFTQDSAQQLANQLKFGALPLSFAVQTEDQISALLGSESLRNGLLAGLIGLLLVVVYSLFQYRALGLVTVFSLLVAAGLTYLTIAVLSWTQGYRLSLPGVAGLIVAIGITADSFIVYFERVRDEVREGRSLVAAVETGWKRARRTIIASDAINLLAAVVLYLLAVGGVRGFAFTLGLTTLIDLVVVFLFTHPMLALMARTKFFGGGHRLSGFDPEQLGRPSAYAGRGRVRQPVPAAAAVAEDGRRMTIAERRAAQAAASAQPAHAPAEAPDLDRPSDDDAAHAGSPSLTKES